VRSRHRCPAKNNRIRQLPIKNMTTPIFFASGTPPKQPASQATPPAQQAITHTDASSSGLKIAFPLVKVAVLCEFARLFPEAFPVSV